MIIDYLRQRNICVSEIKTKGIFFTFHIVFLVVLYSIVSYFYHEDFFAFAFNGLTNWDAGWYKSIKYNNYIFNEGEQSNTAFFPLFPLIWKLFDLSDLGISIFNYFIFGVTLFGLSVYWRISVLNFLLLLSVPSILFMALPYSEAIFFLTSCLLLWGYEKENRLLIVIALLLSCTARSAAFVFIPSVVITEFLKEENLTKIIVNSVVYTVSILLGLFVVVVIQFQQTGKWFAYSASAAQWGLTELKLPKLPFSTWKLGDAGYWIQQLDSLALLVTVFALISLVVVAVKWQRKMPVAESKAFIFSSCYIAGVITLRILFQGEVMISYNRYIFATAFFICFFNEFKLIKYFDFLHYKYIVVFVFVFFLLFTYQGPLYTWLRYLPSILIVLVPLYFLVKSGKVPNWFLLIVYCALTILQVFLFFRFLNGDWIG